MTITILKFVLLLFRNWVALKFIDKTRSLLESSWWRTRREWLQNTVGVRSTDLAARANAEQ